MTRIAIMLSVLLFVATVGRAEDDDHDVARRARQAGDIVPLAKILTQVEATYDGRMIETELERDDGRWVYEIELLTPQGHVIELTYDAHTGAFIEAEGRGLDAARKKP
jgi:uncharacterized membrane protein YkoI